MLQPFMLTGMNPKIQNRESELEKLPGQSSGFLSELSGWKPYDFRLNAS
ncbi:MAG: hypothetical protein JKY95_06850 [Planctomycetaceae bacterium]|nr:hypothetical protein [Planctomycetaceae bacterium]